MIGLSFIPPVIWYLSRERFPKLSFLCGLISIFEIVLCGYVIFTIARI